MPRLSVWFVRAALLYLAGGFTLGALMLWNKALPLAPWIWRFLPVHMEFLLMGWTAQLAIGIAFWILPRFATRRGNVPLAWVGLVLLNLGVLLVCCGPFVPRFPWLGAAGRLSEAVAVLAVALHVWPRIKPPGV